MWRGVVRMRRPALFLLTSPFLMISSAFAMAQRDMSLSPGFDAAIDDPTSRRVSVCHGFGCRMVSEVTLGGADRARLAGIMAGAGSPAAERRAVAAATAWFDRRIAPVAGTKNHKARAGVEFTFAKSDGQFDCIDSSRNTTSLLRLLAGFKLLRHHTVGEPVARGFLVDGRMPHATAVLVEKKSGESWSIDTWVRSYGQAAEVMPLSRWEAGGGI